MERVQRWMVDDRAKVVSSMLNGLSVHVQGRNGYFGLDLYQETGRDNPNATLVRTLTTGTKREVYTYLAAMLDALEIVGR